MSRGLCVLAALAILAGGCASRRAVDRLESDVGRLRSELAEMRVAQEVTSRDLANVTSQLQALDVKALGDEVARLTRRTDAVDAALAATRTTVEALAAPTGAPSAPPPAPIVPPGKPTPKAPDNPEQEYAAALATYRAREHGQAVIDFLDFIAKYPKHPLAGNAQYWIGEAYWAQRDYRQALVEFEKVFEHGPGKTPDALLKIGLCHLRLTDLPRAQQAWQRVVSEYPKSESATMARSLIATHSAARR